MPIDSPVNAQHLVHSEPPNLGGSEVVIGTLVGLDSNGRPLVNFAVADYRGEAVVAMSTQALRQQDIGREVALLFAGGNTQNPIIMGLIHSPLAELLNQPSAELQPSEDEHSEPLATRESPAPRETRIDGKRLVFEAEDEVVIKCGEAAIVLTKDGKVTIRGKYLLSRASGVNRILGGSVQVN